jgi:hypothetical protein
MFGPCKVCAEKDKRVSSLEAEITFLRSLVRPDAPKNAHRPTAEQLEADALFSGQTSQIYIDEQSRLIEDPSPRLSAEEEAAVAERDAILSGSY